MAIKFGLKQTADIRAISPGMDQAIASVFSPTGFNRSALGYDVVAPFGASSEMFRCQY